MRSLRARLTYANVMSSIAVFMVLGGSAYAAATLPKNSVGSRQIASNAVTSAKVKDGSLLSKDFKPGQLVAGAPGPAGAAGAKGDRGDTAAKGDAGATGATGAAGAAGATTVRVRYVDIVTDDSSNGSGQADCNPGERATGGGVAMIDGIGANVTYFQPGGAPTPTGQGVTPTGWTSSWYNTSGQTDTFRVYAICAAP
jgi:hypothetical protein